MEVFLKIIKSLEDSGLLIKGITQTIETETREQKGRFLGMLFGILVATLLGNMLVVRGVQTTR